MFFFKLEDVSQLSLISGLQSEMTEKRPLVLKIIVNHLISDTYHTATFNNITLISKYYIAFHIYFQLIFTKRVQICYCFFSPLMIFFI